MRALYWFQCASQKALQCYYATGNFYAYEAYVCMYDAEYYGACGSWQNAVACGWKANTYIGIAVRQTHSPLAGVADADMEYCVYYATLAKNSCSDM